MPPKSGNVSSTCNSERQTSTTVIGTENTLLLLQSPPSSVSFLSPSASTNQRRQERGPLLPKIEAPGDQGSYFS